MPITYPRPCPICGTKIKNRGNFFRHKKYCGTNVKVQSVYCDKVFCGKNKMTAHVKKCHSEVAKRKAEEDAELLRLELLNSGKVPRLSVEEQTGGAVTTRGTKRSADDDIPDVKVTKMDSQGNEAKTDYENRCFKPTSLKWGHLKNGKKEKSSTRSLLLHWITYVTQNQTKIWE